MSRFGIGLVGSLGLVGCYALNPEADPERRKEAIEEETGKLAIEMSCRSGHVYLDNCGLITTALTDVKFRMHFEKTTCTQLDAAVCNQRYYRMLFARFEKRYSLADWSYVKRECDADPEMCDNLKSLEMLILRSHNRGVDALVERRKAKVDVEEAAKTKRVAEALQDMAASMSGRTVCRTEESASGGLKTWCNK